MCEMVLLKMRLRMRVWVVVSCVYLYMFEATCYTYGVYWPFTCPPVMMDRYRQTA